MGILKTIAIIVIIIIFFWFIFSALVSFNIYLIAAIAFLFAIFDSIRRRDFARLILGIVIFILIYFLSGPLINAIKSILPTYDIFAESFINVIIIILLVIPILTTSTRGTLTAIGISLIFLIALYNLFDPLQRIFFQPFTEATGIPLNFIGIFIPIIIAIIVFMIFPK